MFKYSNNESIQFFGMKCLASTFVPLDEELLLTTDALLVYEYVINIISSPNKDYNSTFRIFALNVLYNLLSTHAGRIEFFNVRYINIY